MSNTNVYYGQSHEDRASRVQTLFDRIAPQYDLINDLQSFGLHRLWKGKLISLAVPQSSDHALDVCCGTGDIALSLARQGATVKGIDFSPGMLAEARRRAKGNEKVEFIQADALKIPFPENTFDLVTVGYGLRNITDFRAGLEELNRVLKPGGTLLILDFGKPDNGLWRRLYFAYLRWMGPVFGRIFCGDSAAYAYILESLVHYPAQRGVEQAMRSMDMTQTEIHSILGGVMSINTGRKTCSGSAK